MRTRLCLAAALGLILLQVPALTGALAYSGPPPPPPTPTCGPCGGPPPPPTPIPTLAPTAVPRSVVVAVRLSPARVRRGHAEKLTVKADSSAAVTAQVRYRHGKPVTYRGKIGGSGTYTKSWTVPKTAPIGKATLKISVKGSGGSYSDSESFVVVK